MKKITVTIFLLCLAGFSSIFATGKVYWQADGVLVTGIDGMGIGDLVTDMRGGAYIVTSDLYKVYLIRVDKNGNLPWGLSGITVDTNTYGAFQMNTLGVSDSCGGVIIVWDKFFPTGHILYAQRVDSSGNNMWSGIGRLVTLSDSSQEEHVLISDNQKGVIVAWQESWNGQYDIYAQRLDSSGVRKWGGNGKVVCNAANNQERIGVTTDDSSNSIIVWADYRISPPHIYSDRLNSTGVSLWQLNGKVVCNTDSGQGLSGYGNVITMATDTTIIVVWHDYRNGNNDLYTQCYNLNGNTLWSVQGTPVCDTINLQGSGEIIRDGKGGSIYCWIDERTGFMDIYAQRINANGDKLWLNQGAPICALDSVYWYQRIITDHQSGAIICWQDNRSGNNDIYAQHVDSSGNVKWAINGMAVCTSAGTQERPKMIASDSGSAIIAWPDGRSGQWRAYAQRVGDDPNGVTGEPEDRIQKAEFRIYQNSPNPFRQTTMIKYQIPKSGIVSLKVYNITGQLVKTLINETSVPLRSGEGSVTWDGRDDKGNAVGNGLYFYRLTINGAGVSTRKMALIR